MPQYFQVLRCYKCLVFQVHQVKKSNKFECKLCGEKQSIKRHYGVGTGKECRIHVQKLNAIRGDIDELKNTLSSDDENFEEIENIIQNNKKQGNAKKESKWSEYVEKPETSTVESTNNDFLGTTEVVLEVHAKKRKFTRKRYNNKKKGSYRREDNEECSPEESIVKDSVTKYNLNNSSENSFKLESEIIPVSKKPVTKKFIPPVCTMQSKWAQYADETEQISQEDNYPSDNLEKENVLPKNVHLKVKPTTSEQNKMYPQRNKCPDQTFSKWDFHENTSKPNRIIPEYNVPMSGSNSNNRTQKLFSLCNDNDLDDILDI